MDIAKTLENFLKKYETREIKIDGRGYDLYLPPELSDPDINVYEGFLFVETEEKREVTSIKNYTAPMTGPMPRLSFILYGDKLLIKDYTQNKYITRSLNTLNETFINKIKKAIDKPSETNFDAIFDRKDVIEEFYILFKKARNYLAENIRGIAEEERRREFADDFLMQMMTIWYLQARGFFNNDKNYLITKFKDLSQKRLDGSEFKNYKEFLEYFFEKIRENEKEQYYEDDILGRVVVIGPAIFIGTEEEFKIVDIPDKCFYQDKIKEPLINERPQNIKVDIPILNLFESRDWIEGDIDEYVIGALYEKLITYDLRKKTGSYYTPEKITCLIASNTIEPYLLNSFETNHSNIDALIRKANQKTLITLFNKLRDIKILDPAVGSGHFLESAIDVLVDIYQKLRRRAKYLGLSGFEIIVTDEKGELKTIDLLKIDDDHFNLYLKFFIILSRNIYGVDINPSALKVARARFFLSMAKHFRPSENRDVFVRFPNVHFNLREGNSLIGYERVGKDKVDLFSFSGPQKNDRKYIVNKIQVMDDLKEYLEFCSKTLALEGNINSDIENLNFILSKDKIKWGDIERILKIKEKLISILIVSLNSKQAVAINDLLNSIDELFYNKFDEKFADEYGIPVERVKELKAFHWILDFPEVFAEKDGFDIVIGNPPYLRHEEIEEELKFGLKNLKNYYETYDSTANLLVYFFERGIRLLKEKGMFSYISSNKFTRAAYGKNLRRYLMKYSIEKYVDYTGERVFKGVTVDASVIVIKKVPPTPNNKILVNEKLEVNQNYLNEEGWTLQRPEIYNIKEKIEEVGIPLQKWDVNIYRGVLTGFNKAFIINGGRKEEILESCRSSEERKMTEKIIKPILRGRDIKRYSYDWKDLWLILIEAGWTESNRGDKEAEEFFREYYPAIYDHLLSFAEKKGRGKGLFERDDQGDYWWELRPCDYYLEFEKEKLVFNKTTQHYNYVFDSTKKYVNQSAYIMTGDNLKYLLGILNSSLGKWIYKEFYSGGGIEGEITIFTLERLPIPPITKENKYIAEEIDKLVYQILILNNQRQFIFDSFRDLTENQKSFSRLKQYLKDKNAPIYSIYSYKKLIEENKEAIPRLYSIKSDKNYLIINVTYKDESNEDVLKIQFDDPEIQEFFNLAISVDKNEKNYRSEKNVIETVLSDIKIPKLDKKPENDANKMKELIKEIKNKYTKFINSKAEGTTIKLELIEIDKKIKELDKKIDQLVYQLYGISEDDIKLIEEEIS